MRRDGLAHRLLVEMISLWKIIFFLAAEDMSQMAMADQMTPLSLDGFHYCCYLWEPTAFSSPYSELCSEPVQVITSVATLPVLCLGAITILLSSN